MKSERRHELQHNLLAEWLITNYGRVKPYQNAILGVLILTLVAVVGYKFWSWYSSSRHGEAWEQADAAVKSESTTELEKLIQRYPGTPAAVAGALLAGDLHQQSGTNLLFTDKESASKDLGKAVECFETALKSTKSPLLRERATFSLARALESQAGAVDPKDSQAKLDEAVKYYKDVAKEWPNGAFAISANERLEALEKAATKSIYERFAAYTPPVTAPTPSPGAKDSPDAADFRLGPLLADPPGADPLKYEPLKVLRSPGVKEGDLKEAPKPGQGEKPITPPAEKTPATPTGKLSDTPPAKPAEKTTEKAVATPTEKPAEKAPEKPADKPPEKPAAAPEKPSEKTPATPEEKAAEKPAAAPEKPAEKAPDKPTEKK